MEEQPEPSPGFSATVLTGRALFLSGLVFHEFTDTNLSTSFHFGREIFWLNTE